MKTPKLLFKRALYVTSWSNEIIKGWSAKIDFIMNISQYENKHLFQRDDGVMMIVDASEVYDKISDAAERLKREQIDRKRYYTKVRDEAIEKLKSMQ